MFGYAEMRTYLKEFIFVNETIACKLIKVYLMKPTRYSYIYLKYPLNQTKNSYILSPTKHFLAIHLATGDFARQIQPNTGTIRLDWPKGEKRRINYVHYKKKHISSTFWSLLESALCLRAFHALFNVFLHVFKRSSPLGQWRNFCNP